MMPNGFEEAFGTFLERREYDEAESALFSIVRAAFLSGWLAAGGEQPIPQKVFEVIRCGGAGESLQTQGKAGKT